MGDVNHRRVVVEAIAAGEGVLVVDTSEQFEKAVRILPPQISIQLSAVFPESYFILALALIGPPGMPNRRRVLGLPPPPPAPQIRPPVPATAVAYPNLTHSLKRLHRQLLLPRINGTDNLSIFDVIPELRAFSNLNPQSEMIMEEPLNPALNHEDFVGIADVVGTADVALNASDQASMTLEPAGVAETMRRLGIVRRTFPPTPSREAGDADNAERFALERSLLAKEMRDTYGSVAAVRAARMERSRNMIDLKPSGLVKRIRFRPRHYRAPPLPAPPSYELSLRNQLGEMGLLDAQGYVQFLQNRGIIGPGGI